MPRPKKFELIDSLIDSQMLQQKVNSAYKNLYKLKKTPFVGWPLNDPRIDKNYRRPNTSAIIGAALGDEGKGRTIDNLIQTYLANSKIKKVYVVRYQGGNNAGHSLQAGGIKWAQHLVPSGVHRNRVFGIMDSGMVIHPEDLVTEISVIEKATKSSLKNKLALSPDAILNTDLDRAKEVLNRILDDGSKGGTGRGIGPSYAGYYDRQGLQIRDLIADDWQETLTKKYMQMSAIFKAFKAKLADSDVPDFSKTKSTKKSQNRKVGNLEEFLDRLKRSRKILIKLKLVKNTFKLHQQIIDDSQIAILFEASQAVGLHPWVGTHPDVTSSDTSLYGIQSGTKFWRSSQIMNPVGVMKATYTSSVGARRMPTQVDLPYPIPENYKLSTDQSWADYVRTTAHEFGSTTGRPRDILKIDIGFLNYNVYMGGIEALVLTHMDIARLEDTIEICYGYKDKNGKFVPYQPGLSYLEGLTPVYERVPSWDGNKVIHAKTLEDLPENAIRYAALIQSLVGVPVVAMTTGPDEKDYIEIPGYF